MSFLRWCRNEWERSAAIASVGLGLVVLLLGWIGVSGVSRPGEQIPYVVSGGILGLFLLAVGSTLWLSADLHDEWRKLDDIENALSAVGLGPEPQGSAVDASAQDQASRVAWVRRAAPTTMLPDGPAGFDDEVTATAGVARSRPSQTRRNPRHE